MKAPDTIKVKVGVFGFIDAYYPENCPPNCDEYISRRLHDETIKTAEDHAYFAGKEKLREELLEWAKKEQKESGNIMEEDFWQEVIDKLNQL